MPSAPPSGRLRPLVPFFASSPDGTLVVNDTLTPTPSTPSITPLVDLPVRVWDHAQGVFRDSSHKVADLPPPPSVVPAAVPVAKPPARLLTPADIRAARAASRAASRAAAAAATAASPRSPVHHPSTPVSVIPVRTSATATLTPTKKKQAFAGSTFESASPPPARLPIPAFVTRTKSTSAPMPIPKLKDAVSIDARERAAVDLRRMLKI